MVISLRSLLMACATLAVAACAAAPAAAEPPGSPLIETTCSYEQLEAAVRVEAPKLAEFLADKPAAQTKARDFLALSPADRRQRLQDVLDRNPEWRKTIDERRGTPEGQAKVARMQRIADTCHGY